jgi:hypothetical protein
MSRTTVHPLLVYYLGATPVFFLIDVGLDLSLRASFLESAAARVGYYVFCVACGLAVWRRPGSAPFIGLGESAVTITLLMLGFMRPILSLSGELALDTSAEIGAPVNTESIVNFVIAAGVAWWSFQRWVRVLAVRSGTVAR